MSGWLGEWLKKAHWAVQQQQTIFFAKHWLEQQLNELLVES
jgi:hypothetical protein